MKLLLHISSILERAIVQCHPEEMLGSNRVNSDEFSVSTLS